MKTLADIRKEYPQYEDMSDVQLADALHRKFYSDIPRADFDTKIGLKQTSAPQPPAPGSAVKETLASVVGSNPITRGLAGAGGGLIRRGAGVVQAGAELVGADGVARQMGEVVQDVNRNLDSERFGTAGRVGAVIGGDIAPFVALPAGAASAAGRAVMGGAAGALEGFTRGNETSDFGQRVANTATSAMIGAAAAPVIGAGVDAVKGFTKGLTAGLPAAAKTSEDVKALASAAYRKADEVGGVLKTNITDNFLDNVAAKLKPQTAWEQAARGKNDALSELADNLLQMRGKGMTLGDAQNLDEFLSEYVEKLTDKGQITKEARRVLNIQDALRKSIESAGVGDVVGGKVGFDALQEGRKTWKTALQMRDIERIIERAEMTDNPATSIKAGFRNLTMNPERMRGYAPEVRKMIESAAKSGVVGDSLRVAGSRFIPILTASTGNLAGAVAGQAATTGARGVGSRVAVDRAVEILDKIAGNAKRPSVAQKVGAAVRSRLTAPDPRAKPVRINLDGPNQ